MINTTTKKVKTSKALPFEIENILIYKDDILKISLHFSYSNA